MKKTAHTTIQTLLLAALCLLPSCDNMLGGMADDIKAMLGAENRPLPEISVTYGERTIIAGDLIDMGYTLQDDSKQISLVISNSGAVPVALSDIAASDGDITCFTAGDFTAPATLAPAGTATFTVNFTDAAAGQGARVAVVSIETQDESGEGYAPFNFTVTCERLEEARAKIEVWYGLTLIPDGGAYDMGSLTGTDQSAPQAAFTIKNIGTATLTFAGIDLTDSENFSVVSAPETGESIDIGSSAVISLMFMPRSTGSHSADAVINYNDGMDDKTFTIELTGTAQVVPTRRINITGPNMAGIENGETYDFEGQPPLVASNNNRTFTISNSGISDLTIKTISLDDTVNYTLDYRSSENAKIPAGGYTYFDVSFNPTTLGPKPAAITITSDDPDNLSFVINLSGYGDVNFVSAIQTGGTPEVAASTGIILTFDDDPVGLAVDDITVNGATKVALSENSGVTRTLTISDIEVLNGQDVFLTITIAGHQIINLWPVQVFRTLIPVTLISAVQTGGTSGTADSTGIILTFDADPTTLTADNITVTGATKGTLTGTGTTRTLAISGITVSNGATVSVEIFSNPLGYSLSGSTIYPVVYRLFSVGVKDLYSADGLSFIMTYVPGGLTFPTGTGDTGIATVANPYLIGETEVNYVLWNKVYTWATNTARGANRYYFRNEGALGGWRTNTGFGSWTQYDDGHQGDPVTNVNWRDAMIWCNALTEWYNAQKGTSYACVYTSDSGYTIPIRDCHDIDNLYDYDLDTEPGHFDNPYVNPNAKGFRLLTGNEFELAARYRGTDTTNVVTGTIAGVNFTTMTTKWTKGNSASGDTGPYNGASVGSYAVYTNNSDPMTANVASKTCNALGLYDMSGNVWEWCFDLYSDTERLLLAGSWDDLAQSLQVGNRSGRSRPGHTWYSFGFRFARSQ